MKTSYLFVYGTLRHSAEHPMAAWLAARTEPAGPTILERAALYELDGFPGMKRESGEVHGELVQMQEIQRKQVLEVLDEYEGLDPVHGYERTIIEVPVNGEKVQAWAYFFCGAIDGRRRIPHGDWLRWVREGNQNGPAT